MEEDQEQESLFNISGEVSQLSFTPAKPTDLLTHDVELQTELWDDPQFQYQSQKQQYDLNNNTIKANMKQIQEEITQQKNIITTYEKDIKYYQKLLKENLEKSQVIESKITANKSQFTSQTEYDELLINMSNVEKEIRQIKLIGEDDKSKLKILDNYYWQLKDENKQISKEFEQLMTTLTPQQQQIVNFAIKFGLII